MKVLIRKDYRHGTQDQRKYIFPCDQEALNKLKGLSRDTRFMRNIEQWAAEIVDGTTTVYSSVNVPVLRTSTDSTDEKLEEKFYDLLIQLKGEDTKINNHLKIRPLPPHDVDKW